MKFDWKKVSENLLPHNPKSKNLKIAWKIFPRNPLSHGPFFGNSFRDLLIWVKWQIKAYFYSNPSINFLFEEFHAYAVNETFPWFFLGFYIFFLFYFTCPRWILNPVELKSIESHWIAKNLKSWQFGLTI